MRDNEIMSAKEARYSDNSIKSLPEKSLWLIKNKYLKPNQQYANLVLEELIKEAIVQNKHSFKLSEEKYRAMGKFKDAPKPKVVEDISNLQEYLIKDLSDSVIFSDGFLQMLKKKIENDPDLLLKKIVSGMIAVDEVNNVKNHFKLMQDLLCSRGYRCKIKKGFFNPQLILVVKWK